MVKIVSQKYFSTLSVEKILFFNLFLKTKRDQNLAEQFYSRDKVLDKPYNID